MTAEPPTDPKALWRNQPTQEVPLSLEHIHARTFQYGVRGRNLVEYVAGAVVVAVFSAYAIYLPGFLIKLGSVLTVLATFLVLWQLNRRSSAKTPPLGADASLVFHRQELVRQRGAARTAWLWYWAPFLPGLALNIAGHVRALGWGALLLVGGLAVLVYAVGLWLNLRGARGLQAQIDELDALARE